MKPKHGCVWWYVTGMLAFIVLAGVIAALPAIWALLLALAVAAAIFGLIALFAKQGFNYKYPPLRKGKPGQPHWSVTKKWWWTGEYWTKPEEENE